MNSGDRLYNEIILSLAVLLSLLHLPPEVFDL